jgi:hypothetical protein
LIRSLKHAHCLVMNFRTSQGSILLGKESNETVVGANNKSSSSAHVMIWDFILNIDHGGNLKNSMKIKCVLLS